MLKVGEVAPYFALTDQNNDSVSSKDFLEEKILVIFFYPKDFTPGCTAESCSFRDSSEEFSRYDAQIIGISEDDSNSHKKFDLENRLGYPLLTDKGSVVAKSFGVKKTFGLLAGRATFVIDKKGIVQMAYSSQINVSKHIDESLRVVQRLHGA